ncbi:hypothetical protein P7C70_g4268, partial [Phenoliferia sp. Uapishka_3]
MSPIFKLLRPQTHLSPGAARRRHTIFVEVQNPPVLVQELVQANLRASHLKREVERLLRSERRRTTFDARTSSEPKSEITMKRDTLVHMDPPFEGSSQTPKANGPTTPPRDVETEHSRHLWLTGEMEGLKKAVSDLNGRLTFAGKELWSPAEGHEAIRVAQADKITRLEAELSQAHLDLQASRDRETVAEFTGRRESQLETINELQLELERSRPKIWSKVAKETVKGFDSLTRWRRT